MAVLTSHSKDWLPVRLRDLESVAYLNELFDAGWYLMPLAVDGLMALAFSVPAEPVREDARQVIWSRDPTPAVEAISVVVLRRGGIPGRQRAEVILRDAHGYLDLRATADMRGWQEVTTVHLESDGLVAILEREDFGGARR